MLCAFCTLTILGDAYRIQEKSPKSSADKMNRPCESKDQTPKKIRTLHFPEKKKTGAKSGTKLLGRQKVGVWNGGGWIRQISGPEYWNFRA